NVEAGLDPHTHAANIALLCDVGELLAEGFPGVDVAVQREFAGRDVRTRFEAGTGHGVALDARAGRVLPVDVANEVEGPRELRTFPREVEPRLELRQPGGLSVAHTGRAI